MASSVAEERGQAAVAFGLTAADYGRHRKGYPPVVSSRLLALGVGVPGQDVVDLGCGTGHLTRDLALGGARVVGIDPSPALLDEARRLDALAGASARYVVGSAEGTGLPAGCADAVTAAQCWHWFDSLVAAREALRLLRPGGRLAIVHFDWLPRAGNVVAVTEDLIEAHNPAWRLGGGDGLYPRYYRDLHVAGFGGLESFTLDVDVPYDHEGWRGRIRASAGVGAALAPAKVAAFDAELAATLKERFPEEPLAVPHRIFCLVGRAPDGNSL